VPVGELPATTRGYITFGSFNNAGKVNRYTVALWSAILRKVPDARICLRNSAFEDTEVQARYRHWFNAHGVTDDRVDFASRVGYVDYLAAYGDVDIALDSFPYNGGMTSMEGLWMGVPLITLRGERFASRLGSTVLSSIGLQELIADSPAEYVTTAVALARDMQRLAALRAELRGRMSASPLCDPARFTRGLEAAYRQMWTTWCASHSR
jgi:protein O-GlcNAc transferase